MQTISKKGIVIENLNGNVKVMIQKESGCGSCSSCGGCEIKPSYYTTFTNENLNPGDFVYLDSDIKTVNKLSYFTYLFPVIMMITGAILANTVFKDMFLDNNLLTVLFIFIFLALSIFVLRIIDTWYENEGITTRRKA